MLPTSSTDGHAAREHVDDQCKFGWKLFVAVDDQFYASVMQRGNFVTVRRSLVF